MTYAKVICDSISPTGSRLTTIEGELHRFCLAELNTHRAFSRNSASSRAIPVKKQIARVLNDLAYPIAWPKEQKGMQGGEELVGVRAGEAAMFWRSARDAAVKEAERLMAFGVHKSVTNRLLEPFMWHKVIISSTEAGWENFVDLRCSPLAQPEIRVFAEAVRDAYDDSTPDAVEYGGWHLPYITSEDARWALQQGEICDVKWIEVLKRLSVARSARVSTLNHDGVRDPAEDLAFFERLASAVPMHASPMEHVATPCLHPVAYSNHRGNFDGWDQFRHQLEAGS